MKYKLFLTIDQINLLQIIHENIKEIDTCWYKELFERIEEQFDKIEKRNKGIFYKILKKKSYRKYINDSKQNIEDILNNVYRAISSCVVNMYTILLILTQIPKKLTAENYPITLTKSEIDNFIGNIQSYVSMLGILYAQVDKYKSLDKDLFKEKYFFIIKADLGICMDNISYIIRSLDEYQYISSLLEIFYSLKLSIEYD